MRTRLLFPLIVVLSFLLPAVPVAAQEAESRDAAGA